MAELDDHASKRLTRRRRRILELLRTDPEIAELCDDYGAVCEALGRMDVGESRDDGVAIELRRQRDDLERELDAAMEAARGPGRRR